MLLFRDYLRKHPDVSKKYSELKKELSLKAKEELLKYSELKSSFIENVLKKARKEIKCNCA